jgi:RNA polymerase sigma-70 factor, ECF subfamily
MMLHRSVDAICRNEGGRILAGLIRRCGDIDQAEDALQEAFSRALITWAQSGLPANPAAWLTTVAQRLIIDRARNANESHRADVDDIDLENIAADATHDPLHQLAERNAVDDDMLRLIFTCCHPALAASVQTALALKTICQLSVEEIARAYIEPPATTAQRLVRAKRKIAEAKIAYEIPEAEDLPARVDAVLGIIYLVFNEGYTAANASQLMRVSLCDEAIRLGHIVSTLLPTSAEARGLCALMQLTHARRDARVDADGDLISLDEQDRTRWDHAAIASASSLLDEALLMRAPGPYQIEAAIASLHCQAKTAADTDWPQISALYGALWRHRPTDVVALNAAVAHAMAFSIDEGLARIDAIATRERLNDYHLLHAARADLLRRKGDHESARAAYERALALTHNEAEQRYLQKRLDALAV